MTSKESSHRKFGWKSGDVRWEDDPKEPEAKKGMSIDIPDVSEPGEEPPVPLG